MINLQKGLVQTVYFTGSENKTLPAPFFLFIFLNRITGEKVSLMAENTSPTLRYDKFSLTVDDHFEGATTGFWDYKVYEKEMDDDFEESGNIVEQGFMVLQPAVSFSPTEYSEQSNNFVTYNG